MLGGAHRSGVAGHMVAHRCVGARPPLLRVPATSRRRLLGLTSLPLLQLRHSRGCPPAAPAPYLHTPGDMLASCSGDRTVRIWRRDAASPTGRWLCSAILEDTHSRTIRSACWSPCGRHLATASFDRTTAIWQHSGGVWENVAMLEGHESEVKEVAWNPNGSLIATCSRDKTVWLWEAQPGNEYEVVDVKHGHSQVGGAVCGVQGRAGLGWAVCQPAGRGAAGGWHLLDLCLSPLAAFSPSTPAPCSLPPLTPDPTAGRQDCAVAPAGGGACVCQLRRQHQAVGGGRR